MKKLRAISAAIVSSLMLAAISCADTAPAANKWRIELDGQALKTGEIQWTCVMRSPRIGAPRSSPGRADSLPSATNNWRVRFTAD